MIIERTKNFMNKIKFSKAQVVYLVATSLLVLSGTIQAERCSIGVRGSAPDVHR